MSILKVFSIVVIFMGVYYPLKDKLVCYSDNAYQVLAPGGSYNWIFFF